MSQLSSRARVELARAALSRIGLESPELRPYADWARIAGTAPLSG